MFSRFRKETRPLQLYGKLPIAKDYLRVGGGQGTGLQLRDWLDQGFSSTAERGSAPEFPWAARFLMPGEGDEPLMGCAWPSSDEGGHRRFPFVVYIERRRRALLSSFAEGMGSLQEVWAKLEGFHAACDNYPDGQSFLAAMRGHEIDVEEGDDTIPARINLEAWTSAMWPSEGQEGLVRTLASLRRLADDRYPGPLRLPLSGDLASAAQVHGWWTALAEVKLLGAGDVPTVFFPGGAQDGEEPAFAVFFRGRLRPGDAAWVSSARGQSNLGTGDFCIGGARLAGEVQPASENAPSLAESIRGALVSARSRS